ncbi:DegT/DnrJ/EryC1/StrS family aminotransferase [Marinibaculum pumilum]|uniref:DegT/DnrJ/EryC1/StrS family aminotransferase n=1 Tax=Marinibaculum pumilum TaxID=1766165 RepID=A0ABV7L2K1_9PROT
MPPQEPFYPLAASQWDQAELDALAEVIASDMFTMGERVRTFEAAFAAYHGRAHAVMVNSGSSANLVGIASQFFTDTPRLQRGDEVIVPALSWSTTFHPLQQYGLHLRFVDIDPQTLNIDPAALEAALTPRTRMVMAVSILGNPCDFKALQSFCRQHGLLLFEDNCESLDAGLGGRKTGTFGDISTASFFFSHHISTMEGGMMLTDDRETADLARCLRAHGWTRDLAPDSPVYARGRDDFFEAYKFVLPGYNLRPGELHAAVGMEQLRKLPAHTTQRRRNLAHFQARFGNHPVVRMQREHGESSAFSFPLVLRDPSTDRGAVMAALKEADIAYRIVTGGCFIRHPAIRFFDHSVVGDLPHANEVHDRGFFVGNLPRDLTAQIDRLDETIRAAAG